MLQRITFLRFRTGFSLYSTAAEQKIKFDDFRTLENNPTNHKINHISKFYEISIEAKKQVFSHGGLPKSFEKQVKTFGEVALMVREPAVELINYLNNTDFSKPAVRYVLYGKDGVGKSLTLAHLLHYGHINNFVLVHIPWVPDWFKKPKEVANSSTKEGFIDLPLDAAAWLIHFKTQNSTLLAKLGLRVSKEYVWSKRESTPIGASFLDLIEHGISRVKFASETIAALLDELKLQSTQGKCRTMVAIDGYNAFFYPHTRLIAENKVKVTPDKVTLTEPFLNITNYDWTNGVCLLTADRIALTEGRMDSELPRYLLGKEGFEHLDPFVPIKIYNYTEKDYTSCIDYYLNRRWIQNQKEGFEKELKFLSGKNPYNLMQICAPL